MEFHPAKSAWTITCSLHISIKIRRIFTRINEGSGYYFLSDTIENCFDLLWFIDRYPLDLTVGDREYLIARAGLFSEQSTLIDKLVKGIVKPKAFELAVPPREYECISAQMTLALGGLLNADETGLGKTVEAILCFTDPRTIPVVVVTLTDLPIQWEERIQEFTPQLTTHIIRGGTPYDLTQLRNRGGAQALLCGEMPHVLIMNYQKLPGWASTLAKFAKMVVWDEVQELRSGPGTQRFAAACELADAVDFRLGLSATPIYNYGAEFYNVLRCIKPGALGTREEFQSEWCGGNGSKIKNPEAFGTYLESSGLMLRRTALEVGRQLPGNGKPLIIPQHIGADAAAFHAISRSCADLARTILSKGQGYRGEKREASHQFTMKLRQATGIAKAPFVADFTRLLIEQGEKPVLFGFHREFYSIVLERLKDLNPVMNTGSESQTQKRRNKEAYLRGDSPLWICSNRSGIGVDGLQAVSRVVINGELDFCPAIHYQNIRRVYRDGQKDIVRAYFAHCDFGSDPYMSDLLGLKTHQSSKILDQAEGETDFPTEMEEDHVKKLALAYLQQIGEYPKNSKEETV